MDEEEALSVIKTFSLNKLQRALSAMKRSKSGRVSSLRARLTRLLQHPDTAADCASVVLGLAHSFRDGSAVTQRAVADTTSRMPSSSDDFDNDSRSSHEGSPEEVFSWLPIHPDVKFRSLPFYEQLSELVKPTSLNSADTMVGSLRGLENVFYFHLTPAQASLIKGGRHPPEYLYQVLLRIGLNETTSEQNDCFPPGMTVSVNGHQFPLPQVSNNNTAQVEKMQPLPITQFIRLDPTFRNNVMVTARPHFQRFAVGVYLVKKLTSQNLLCSLKNKGVKVACYTKAMIIQKLKSDENEIALTHLLVKLTCPLSKRRIQVPCRATTCEHIQCFDCTTYLQLNERKPTWLCPVCNKSALFENLAIDEYFQEILSNSQADETNEVQLKKDGNWYAVGMETEKADSKSSIKLEKEVSGVQLLTLTDSEEECSVVDNNWTAKSKTDAIKEVEVLELSDDSIPSTNLPRSTLPPKKRIFDRPKAMASRSKEQDDDNIICISSSSGDDSDTGVANARSRSSCDSDSGDQLPLLNPAAIRPGRRANVRNISTSVVDTDHQVTSSVTDKTIQYAINQAKSSSTTLVISKTKSSNLSRLGQLSQKRNMQTLRPAVQPVILNEQQSEKILIVNSIIEEILRNVCRDHSENPSLDEEKLNQESNWDVRITRSKRGIHSTINDGTGDIFGSEMQGTESQACVALLRLADYSGTLLTHSESGTKRATVEDSNPNKKEHSLRAPQRRRPTILRRSAPKPKPSPSFSREDFQLSSESSSDGSRTTPECSPRRRHVVRGQLISSPRSDSLSCDDSSDESWINFPSILRSARRIDSDSEESSEAAAACPEPNNARWPIINRISSQVPPKKIPCQVLKDVPSASASSSMAKNKDKPDGNINQAKSLQREYVPPFVPAILKRTPKKCVKRSAAVVSEPEDSTVKQIRTEPISETSDAPRFGSKKKKRSESDNKSEIVNEHEVGLRESATGENPIPKHGEKSKSKCEGTRRLRPRAPHSYLERSPSPLTQDEPPADDTSPPKNQDSISQTSPILSKPNILRKRTGSSRRK